MRRAGRATRIVGVGLLLPGLLLSHPAVAAEPRPAKPPVKKPVSRPHRSVPPARESAAGGAERPCVHVVRSGDSVSRVATRYGVPRRALIETNRLARPEALRLGQRLSIPGCNGAADTRPDTQKVSVSRDGSIVARVGPRRIPTKLFLGVPALNGRAIDFVWPVEGPVVSSFGRRRSGWHAGADIRAEVGTPILAAAPGIVTYSGWARAYGRVVKIEHENGFLTIYAHNLQNFVEVGDRVETGTVVGIVGKSGRATAYHLHFEIRMDGMAYDPVHLLPSQPLAVARAAELTEPMDQPDEDDEEE